MVAVMKRINACEKYQIPVKASSYMYPPIRLDKEIVGYGSRLSPADSAKYSVLWDKLRFSEKDFQARAEAMKNFLSIDEKKCCVDMEEGINCRAGSTSFWITWDGQMRPCGMMPKPTTYPLKVGFENAWEQIRTLTKEIHQPAKCTSCAKKDICGACAAVCVAETGEFDKVPIYMCQRTEEIIRQTIE